MKVLAATRNDASSYYRIEAPFSLLRYQGLDVDITRPAADKAGEYDVLWLHMHADPLAEITARAFKEAGAKIVYDVDDWLFAMPPSWHSYDHYYDRATGQMTERLAFHERLIQMADVVTTTTDYLAFLLSRRFMDKQIAVLPNCVMMGDWDILPPVMHDRPGPMLGWFGTDNHWDDWMEIAEAVATALHNADGYLALIGAPSVVASFPDDLLARTLIHPLVPMYQFKEARRLIKACDVGLAWATDRLEISKCRSPLKVYQWAAAGKPVVISHTLHYAEQPMEATPDYHLAEQLEYMLTQSANEREKVGTAHQNWVFEYHSYERNATMWKNIIMKAMEEKC